MRARKLEMKPQIMGGLHPLEFQEMDLNLIPQVNVLQFFLKLSKFATDMMVKLQVEIFVLHTLLLSKVCFLYAWIVQICCRSSCKSVAGAAAICCRSSCVIHKYTHLLPGIRDFYYHFIEFQQHFSLLGHVTVCSSQWVMR